MIRGGETRSGKWRNLTFKRGLEKDLKGNQHGGNPNRKGGRAG